MKATDNTYMTVSEIAKHMNISVKAARDFFIHGRRVRYVQLTKEFRVVRESFLEWVRNNTTNTVRR